MKKITQLFLEREYIRVTGVEAIASDQDRRGVVMLACCVYGHSVDALKAQLSYSPELITDCLNRMLKAKIIRKGTLAVDWFAKDGGGIAFCCDAAVVEGWLRRSEGKK